MDPLHSLVNDGMSVRFEDLPTEAVEIAQQCVLDTLGTALAGAEMEAPRIVRETALLGAPTGKSLVWGTSTRTDAGTAALANGTAAHVLDFDDWAPTSRAHQSVVLVPVILAAAEESSASGREVIAALVAGYETAERLGAVLGVSQYLRGFHTTGTVGVFSAALAASRLARLSRQEAYSAFNLAATQGAGLKALFGTMAKSYHAGRAAQAGITSSRLAAAGFVADKDAVFGAQGFAEAHSDEHDLGQLGKGIGSPLYILDNVFKHHASCFGTHAAIEASLAAQREHGVRAADVAAIRLTVAEEILDVCAVPWPASGLDGKFSLAFTTALAWKHGRADIDLFVDEVVADPEMYALREKITVDTSSSMGPLSTIVDLTLTDGTTLTVDKTMGARSWYRHPLERRPALVSKFTALVSPVVGTERAEKIVKAVFELQNTATATPLVSLLRPVP